MASNISAPPGGGRKAFDVLDPHDVVPWRPFGESVGALSKQAVLGLDVLDDDQ